MTNQYISTTELREQSSKVVDKLMMGEDMILIHRSKIIGVIKPLSRVKKITDVAKFIRAIEAGKPKKIIPRHMRDMIYRRNLLARHGKSIS